MVWVGIGSIYLHGFERLRLKIYCGDERLGCAREKVEGEGYSKLMELVIDDRTVGLSETLFRIFGVLKDPKLDETIS